MKHSHPWHEEVEALLCILRSMGMEETIKWGSPVFTYQGKNIVSAGGFQHFFTLWFYDGVFLQDALNVLITASAGKTKALRQWRFTDKSQINEIAIRSYIQEAMQNAASGISLKPARSAMPEIPEELKSVLSEDQALATAFEKLTPFKQREYIEHISSAKRADTRRSRLEKAIPLILEGRGLNDQYR
jgi:uncharacterized protein YdeI (YjbR/CyaY-like superfamily)